MYVCVLISVADTNVFGSDLGVRQVGAVVLALASALSLF